MRAGRALWLLALLAFLPLTAARPGLDQPNPCDAVPPAECGVYRKAILGVPSTNGVLALGYARRGMYGFGTGTEAVQMFSYERFGPFGLPAGWVCAEWRARGPDDLAFRVCPPHTGVFSPLFRLK